MTYATGVAVVVVVVIVTGTHASTPAVHLSQEYIYDNIFKS